MAKLKTIFMGTPDFAAVILEALINSQYEVMSVVTQPDKPVGRSGKPKAPPVKELAIKHDIRVMQPESAGTPEFIQELTKMQPDVVIVAAYGRILKPELLKIPRLGCINVHASLLPRYRGASPIQSAVINGDEYSGVTIMLMDEGIDTGDIISQKKIKLDEKETAGSLFERLSEEGAKLLVDTLQDYADGRVVPEVQDEALAVHTGMLSKSMGLIDFKKSASDTERLIRGLNPWPGAYTFLNKKKLTIWSADVFDAKDKGYDIGSFSAGEVIKANKDMFLVKCNESILNLCEIQIEGKKRMQTADFLNGIKVPEGTLLGK